MRNTEAQCVKVDNSEFIENSAESQRQKNKKMKKVKKKSQKLQGGGKKNSKWLQVQLALSGRH